jgi:hypothetical protein
VSWLSLLLPLAALGGTPAQDCSKLSPAAARSHCRYLEAGRAERDRQIAAARRAIVAVPRPSEPPATGGTPSAPGSPSASPTPGASPTPTPVGSPTPTPTPGPVYPSRTGVDLVDGEEWTVRPSYRILAAGRIEFVTTNVGEDDHDLSVRYEKSTLGRLPLAPGESDTLTLNLPAGSYELFCSLEGHEALGMRAPISVR